MRSETKVIEYYTYEELSVEAKEKALDELRYSQVDHYWWEFIEGDLKEIDCKLIGFDTDRGNYCELSLGYETDVIDKILKNHGEASETYKLALEYQEKILDIDGNIDVHEALEFKKALQEEYLSILRSEYEYLVSDEVIEEMIIVNEYEFSIEGKLS